MRGAELDAVRDGAPPQAERVGAVTAYPPPASTFEFRRVQEAQASGLAAKRASPSELREIEAAAVACRHGLDSGNHTMFNEGDDAFHLGVSAASHNAFLVAAVREARALQLQASLRLPPRLPACTSTTHSRATATKSGAGYSGNHAPVRLVDRLSEGLPVQSSPDRVPGARHPVRARFGLSLGQSYQTATPGSTAGCCRRCSPRSLPGCRSRCPRR